MSHVPRPLARKLDRLARRAHRFHRFAHHPLCVEYAPEVVRLGRRTRVCRGCALSLGGCALGSLGALVLSQALPLAGAASIARACAGVFALSMLCAAGAWVGLRPPTSAQRAHAATRKLVTRFLPALAFGFASVLGVRTGGVAGLLLVGSNLALAALIYVRYRRRGPDRSPCLACPERVGVLPCRGFAPIVQRERAFLRSSRRMLALY